ncbi:hypothetical protein D9619_000662 [Psilocybe cf. subviscida]|uniref:Chromate transporter n=1 Tax=Psilocybe cf. subviscida TaxID=2480587 RepID=A0A8H5BGM4_9AGAR|nr:hypothetical protein D9619_000662 [Psilocybe cf. subviscida]
MSFDAFVHSILRRGRRSIRAESDRADDGVPHEPNTSKLATRLIDVFLRTYDLGFTAFGGPPVHFQIFHRRFVDGLGKAPWIDEETYQNLFAISQALPGPASTKMLFNIAQIHAGLIPALFVFLIWSLPGAIAMFAFSLGVQKINDHLPGVVYGLLSGLNAAIVGLIALAGVQLARKAITDRITRLLVLFGGGAGVCYNRLWYFPTLLVGAGVVTVFWDLLGQNWARRWKNRRQREPSLPIELEALPTLTNAPAEENIETKGTENVGPVRRTVVTAHATRESSPERPATAPAAPRNDVSAHRIPVKFGAAIICAFLSALTLFLLLRGLLHHTPLLLALFNNMFLAGTIIFGGGPVVIPLLRDYVVDPGWVSPRDFLLGLAVIQAMPGPNFNFAVYLGALVMGGPASSKSIPTFVGAFIAFLGIFTPGLWLSIGFQSIWHSLRKRRALVSALRGINAAAVGFVFTAVYRLWEIGYLTVQENQGSSLGQQPWWLVIAASTFTSVEWFNVPPPVAILAGGAAGAGWWGAVGRHITQ